MRAVQAGKRPRGWEAAAAERQALSAADDQTLAGPSWAAARADNARARDFTCNAMMFDPFGALLHDATGGVRDCRARLLRAVGDPGASFAADPARVLRAVRHSARCGARFCGILSLIFAQGFSRYTSVARAPRARAAGPSHIVLCQLIGVYLWGLAVCTLPCVS